MTTRHRTSQYATARSRCLVAVGTVLMLLMAACAGSTASAGSPSSSSQTSTSTPDPTTTTTTKRHHQAAWAPNFGPITANSPPWAPWYADVEVLNCQSMINDAANKGTVTDTGADATVTAIYDGLGQACRKQWNAAAADAAIARTATIFNDCVTAEAQATLIRLVDAYQAGGGAPLDLVAGPASTKCDPATNLTRQAASPSPSPSPPPSPSAPPSGQPSPVTSTSPTLPPSS